MTPIVSVYTVHNILYICVLAYTTTCSMYYSVGYTIYMIIIDDGIKWCNLIQVDRYKPGVN
ncbi:hypothetical protein LCGC14_0351890 [marine sediment metagenome]|uniref:Uncharacterized protein n=1 Tax=marine sediment metagenome TaxID=412755 RepID=A0A0F9TAU7_9ZZZZ